MARPRKENADYFSHDTNMRSHRKIIALRTKYLLEGYAVYNMLLEHIGSCDYFIAKWDIIEQEIIAGDFGVSVEKLIDIVSFCDRLGLIQIVGDTIKCESLTDRLQDLITKRDRERNRVSVAETTQTVAESPQSKVKESKLKNSKEKEIKQNENIIQEEASTTDVVPGSKKSIINKSNKDNAVKVYNKIKEMCTVIDGDLNDCVVLYSKLKLYGGDPIDNLGVIIQKMRDTGLAQFYSTSSPEKLAKNMGTIVEKLKTQDKPKRSYTY